MSTGVVRPIALALALALINSANAADDTLMNGTCPCGPAQQFGEFATREQSQRAATTAKVSYMAQARTVSREVQARKDREYRVMEWSLFPAQVGLGLVPGLGAVVDVTIEKGKEQFREDSRTMAIQAIKIQLDSRPNVTTLSIADKRQIVTDALKAAAAEQSFTPADAFQNEAIAMMMSAVDDLDTRTKLLAAYDQLQDKQHVADKLTLHVALQEKLDALKNGPGPKDQQPAARPSVDSLRVQLNRAADISQAASGQFGAAAGIALRLGNPELGKTLQRGSEVTAVASNVLQAFAGNPMAYLPAINGVLGLFGGGGGGDDLAWLSAALENIGKQIEQLSKQIADNHAETMKRLDYLAFIGEVNNDGIKDLLSGQVSHCDYLIPASWIDENRFVRYEAPLVFASYDDLQLLPYARLGKCRDALQNILVRKEIGLPLTLELSRKGPSLETVKKVKERYRATTFIYPSDDNLNYLFAVPRWVEDYEDDSFKAYSVEARRLAGINAWDPLKTDKVLDPAAVELIGGYALALHGIMDLPGGDVLPAFHMIPRLKPGQHSESLDLLQVALGHVNLALAQQQMLSGVVLEFSSAATKEQVTVYFQEIPHAKNQFGTISIGRQVVGRGARDNYRAMVGQSNQDWIKILLADYRPLGASTVALSFNNNDGQPQFLADVTLPDGKGVQQLILPQPDAIGDRVVVPQADATIRLSRLQARLMMAIKAYTQPVSSSPDLAQYRDALLISASRGN